MRLAMTRYGCCVRFELFPGLQGCLRVGRSGQNETLQLTYKDLKRTEDKSFEDLFVTSSQRHMCDRLTEKMSEAVVMVLTRVVVAQGRQVNQLGKIVLEFGKGVVIEINLCLFYVHASEGATHKMAP